MITPTPPAATPAPDAARAALTIQAVLALLIGLVFAGVFIGAFVTGDVGLKHDLSEVLKALAYLVFGYYFGSSAGSKIKGALSGRG